MRLGISTKVLRDYPLSEAIEIAHRYGYRDMEFWVDDLLTADLSVDEIIVKTDVYGIHRNVHLLTEDLNIASFNQAIRNVSVQQHMEGLRLAGQLGAETATLHPGRKTAKTRTLEAAWEVQLDSIRRLAECAAESGVILCVEAMEKLAGEIVLDGKDLDFIAKRLAGQEALAFTLDISHLHTNGEVCQQMALAKHLQIGNVHISQSKGLKPHLTLFDPAGEIDFRAVFPALAIFYDGPMVIEGYVAGKGMEIAEKSIQWYHTIMEEAGK